MIEKDKGKTHMAFDLLEESQQLLEQARPFSRESLTFYECCGTNFLLRSQFYEVQKDVKTAELTIEKSVKIFESVSNKFAKRGSFVRNFKVILREHARLALTTGKYDVARLRLMRLGELSGNKYNTKTYQQTRRKVVQQTKEGDRWASEREFKRAIPLLRRTLIT
ncbi:MAG: hypothetical protein P1V97_33435, partial [Planctomycetota bacterium]|nr:hypothetical protein [Planctomycetota bacterium]